MYYIFLCVVAQQKSAFYNQCTHMHTQTRPCTLFVYTQNYPMCVCVCVKYLSLNV